MRIYLDTEFNSFGGHLISMALVSEKGHEWYAAKQLPEGVEIEPWVAENVMPKLGIAPLSLTVFLADFEQFIRQFPNCEVFADWPADFEHFCATLSTIGRLNSWRIPIECTMQLILGSDQIAPENPHNALSDARALRDWHMGTLPSSKFYAGYEVVEAH